MINNEIQEKLVERLINRIEKLNETIIKEIGKTLNIIGTLESSQAHKIMQIIKYGDSLDKIVTEISRITELNVKDIYNIFEDEAKLNQEFAKQFYRAKNKDFIPYKENKLLKNQVKAIANMTAGEYVNLSRTMAFASYDKNGKIVYNNIAKTYSNIIDNSILSLTQGKETYQESISKAMKELAGEGIQTVEYATGQTRRLDSAVRMNVLGGMRTMSNELQKQFGNEYGADGVEISVHINSAPDHIDIQGHQFKNEEFNKLQSGLQAEDYKGNIYTPDKDGKDRRPISELNCYHYIFSVVLGVSEPIYSQEQLDEMNKKNQEGFEFEGKRYTNYEGTQLQRKIELEVRKQKDIQIGAVAIGDKDGEQMAIDNITKLTNKYRELSKASGLPTKFDRMKVEGEIKKQKKK